MSNQIQALLIIVVMVVIAYSMGYLMNDSPQQPDCNSGKIVERIETLEEVDGKQVSMVTTYYLIRCSNSDQTKRIQTHKNFPINTQIQLGWIKQ